MRSSPTSTSIVRERIQSNVEDYDNILFSSQEAPIYGCMDPDAVNYNPDATESGETCIYPCALELALTDHPSILSLFC